MWIRWLGFLLLPILAGAGCGAAGGELVKSDAPRDTSPQVAAGGLEAVVSGNTEFALDLYSRLAGEEGNVFFSPCSISVALAMTYAGARGETERQMAEALHFTLPQADLHPALNSLDLELTSRGEGAEGRGGEPFRLHIVNALWGQTGYSLLPEFLDTLAVNYGAGMRLLDFASDPEACRAEINRWAANETEDRVEELVPPDIIDDATRVVLTNATYFDAAWESKFEEHWTYADPFTLLDGSEVTVDMMHQSHTFPYAAGEGYQAIELPYDGGELAMVILLPADGRFSEFEQTLDAAHLEAVIGALQPVGVKLAIPRFQYESAFRLDETLGALGMRDAFVSGLADFSGMDGSPYFLYIQGVVHKALVRVDEEGTEAAAATAVVLGVGVPPGEVKMTIDRPFIFLIRDRKTGAILFLGRVLDPTAE
jgi:serpin B